MRIIQFVQKLRTGGAETVATTYAIEMMKSGKHIVDVMVHDGYEGDTPNEEKLKAAGINVVYASNRSAWYYKRNDLFSRMVRLICRRNSIHKYIAAEQPEVIHFHHTPFSVIKGIADSFPNIKLIYTVHSETNRIFRKKNDIKLAQELVGKNRLLLVALHKRMQEECNELFHISNTIVLNNGIDVDKIQAAKCKRDAYRSELGFKDDDFVVGHVGSMIPVKNHLFLVDVFHHIIKMNYQARLLLVGSGQMKEEVFASIDNYGIRDKVTWLENRSDVPELLSCMDVFVFPSLYEGMPLAVLEAQAAGVRVLVSSTVSNQVLLTDHIKPMSLGDGADAWAKEAVSLAQEERYTGLDDYDIKNVVQEVLKVYQE